MLQARWNPPPNWPAPPAGWTPPPGWYPPGDWPPPPPGWQLWLPLAIEEPFAAAEERRGISGPNIAIALGAGLTGLSAALPWINVVLLGSLNLFNLYQVQEKNPVIPEIVVAAAMVVAGLALARVPGGRMVAFLVGIVGGTLGGLFTVKVIHAVRQSDGLVSVGVGPLVAGAGVLLMTGAAVISMSRGEY